MGAERFAWAGWFVRRGAAALVAAVLAGAARWPRPRQAVHLGGLSLVGGL